MTATLRPRKNAPSQVAQVLTPFPPSSSFSPLTPVSLGEAPVATISARHSKILPDEAKSFFVSAESSTRSTTSLSKRAPNFSACARMFMTSETPSIPSGKPGKFSTSDVVVMSPPGMAPSMTSGESPARAA